MCWPSVDPGRHVVARLDPATYRPHALHGADRAWAETNCYTDLVVELTHALGFEPVAMLPFTLAIDFEGDQWTFFKPATHDLWELYGFDVQELAIWRPLGEHLAEQVEAGYPVLVEVDAYHLPDTAGTAYRVAHSKTTIGVNDINLAQGRMGYFHNAGYFAVEGDDFHALLQPACVPYVEFIKWRRDFLPPRNGVLVGRSLEIARRHLERVPHDNPFRRFKARLARDLDWLVRADIAVFHTYSFATLRQYGACFELAATWLRWLASHGINGVEGPAASLQAIAEGAKAFQFQLARSMARGKPLDLAPLDAMAALWTEALEPLQKRLR
jgi:hypothetical protein